MRYFTRKILSLVATLWVIVTATFFLMKAIPGDPFVQERAAPKEIMEALRRHYGLEDPLWEQYVRYLKSVAKWELGPSFKYRGRTVNDIINEGFPVSATLGAEALAIAIAVGVGMGCLAALKENQWQDRAAMITVVAGVSVPSFVLATLLQYLFALKLGWLPVARWGTFQHTILPALALSAMPAAFIARLTRTSLLEVLQQDYIVTARAKGLPRWRVVSKHALRNALIPVISYLGQLTVNVFTGSFVVEKIFGIPGLGQWFVTSVNNRDYTVIMGTTVFYSVLLVSAIFAVDLLYGVLDPRLRRQDHG